MWLQISSTLSEKDRTVEIRSPEVLIGSGPECDIVLEGENIFRQHARVIHAGNHIFLISEREGNEDIEPVIRDAPICGGTYHWNGRERRIDLNPFEIGEFTVCVTGPPASLIDRRPISLSIAVRGGEPFETFDSPGPEVLIGSSPECDLVLEAEGIFPQHARVVRCYNAFLLIEKRDADGVIEPVLRDTMTEHGSYYHSDGRNVVIDNSPFQVGRFEVRVTSSYAPE